MIPKSSHTAVVLAHKLAPPLQEAARAHEHEFVARAGNLPERLAARAVYPALVREIPVALEIALDAALDHLGTLTFADLAALLSEHSQAKGRTLGWTVSDPHTPQGTTHGIAH